MLPTHDGFTRSSRSAGSDPANRRSARRAAGSLVAVLSLLFITGSSGCAQEEGARLSPLDSVRVELESAELAIQYGRPSTRDREIYGELVPFGEVWRTGANEATHFRTGADLRLGEAELEAGHYTLYTIPEEESWTLIVNGQTGQWGTEYDPERDVARIPMRVEELQSPVDTFTIRIEETPEGEDGSDGTLSLLWERTRAWLPIEVLSAENPE